MPAHDFKISYETPVTCNWCPGCGNLAIWSAFKRACVQGEWNDNNTAIVAGIGCHGHIVNFTKITAFEGLHGRAIPVASGIKLARHDMNVFVFTGDGDCLAEGGNHFIHAARRNQNITVILHDNAIYGLTTGQTSPRSPKGFKSKSTPDGNIEEPLHPLRMALAAGATFLARAYAGDIPKLQQLFIRANKHPGFAVIQILQPCVSFNHVYTHDWYKENIYELPPDYNRADKATAFAKTMEWAFDTVQAPAAAGGKKGIPVGVLYEVHEPTYEEQVPLLANGPLMAHEPVKRDVSKLLNKYR